MSHYQDSISTVLATTGNLGMDPRHVEAWMRLERDTLDSLSPAQFKAEAKMAIQCAVVAGRDESEQLAMSYGL